jgi:hypothetical protein
MSSHWIKQAKEVFKLSDEDRYFETIVEQLEEVNDDDKFSIRWKYAVVRWLRRDPSLRYIRCEWVSPIQVQFKGR